MNRPDIVLLILDTQRADHLSCYGYPIETSPHLDAFAANATRFQHAVAPAQWTVPAHASIFTGRYPAEHATFQMDAVLPAELPTLAERLRAAGYFTIGLSHNPLIGAVANHLDRGFDRFLNYNFINAGLLSANLSQPPSNDSRLQRLRHNLRFLLAELLGYSRRSPLHHLAPVMAPVWQGWLGLLGRTKSSLTEQSLMLAARMIIERRDVQQDQPIFAFINLMGAHVPYAPPAWASQQFVGNKLTTESTQALIQKANNWQVDARNWLDLVSDEAELENIVSACYDAEVAGQDAQVGRFINMLAAGHRLDNTLVVIAADHGDHLGDKQRLNHIFGVYESLVHVPLLIRDPSGDFPHGAVVDATVSTRRLYHTILTAAQAAQPEEERLSLAHFSGNEAQDELVLAEGQPLQWAVTRLETDRPHLVRSTGYDQPARAIYSPNHKLIALGTERQLYAIKQDKAEANDLSQQLPEEVDALSEQLELSLRQMQPLATASYEPENEAVLAQLRQLGYLE